MSILIVEDNAVNAKLLTLMLKANGYQTLLAQHGREALDKLAAGEGIQLIVTDLMMPEMDGLEFVSRVKAVLAYADVPILLTSAHSDTETVAKASRLGCQGFLVKPIDRQQLIERVEQLLRNVPVALRDKESVTAKLDIRPPEYRHLTNVFATQLAAALPVLQAEQGESDEPMSDNLKRLLQELAESAAMLGAEKFLRLYERLKACNLLVRSQCAAILRLFQELDTVLKAEHATSPNRDKKVIRPWLPAGAAPAAEVETDRSSLSAERRQFWLNRCKG